MGINKTLEIAGKVGIKQGVDNCKESNHKTLIIAFDLILFFFSFFVFLIFRFPRWLVKKLRKMRPNKLMNHLFDLIICLFLVFLMFHFSLFG